MDLSHHFTVPTDVEATWAHFQDIAGLAECFPGATLSSADGNSFAGAVKVKLGPIALVYNGSGTFVEKDDTTHRFVVDATGKDKRGNGTAGAKVTLSMAAASDGGTDVEVLTDLAVTGKPAQFGRGVMQDVSDKLLGQFVDCLEQRLGTAPVPEEPIAAPAAPTGPEVVAAVDSSASSASPEGSSPAYVAPPVPPRADPVGATSPAATGTHRAPANDDALDLGAAVIPILAKTYWKQGLGVVVVVALVVVVSRRRR